MYAQNQFLQSPRFASTQQYPANCSPYVGNWYYPVQEHWQHDVPDSEDPTVAIFKKRLESQELIEKFVEENEESSTGDRKVDRESEKLLKISEAREVVINIYRLLEMLKTERQELKENTNLTESEWQERWQKCTALREKLIELTNTFESPEGILEVLKKRVQQRKKKRNRDARRRVEWRVKKARIQERRMRRHAEIDAWIREKQDIIQREKQVELLRKDADIVLADVRGKRSDAKKFLNLLQELQNLRRVKANIARARGENLQLAADQAFENIIGQLLNQWTSLDREYSIEEQGLKLMLKTNNEEKIEKQKRSTFDDWEIVLFGRKIPSCDPARGDLHTLVMIRHMWDKYANFNGEGSRIPIGWVMPVPPSSAAWQKCLRRE